MSRRPVLCNLCCAPEKGEGQQQSCSLVGYEAHAQAPGGLGGGGLAIIPGPRILGLIEGPIGCPEAVFIDPLRELKAA